MPRIDAVAVDLDGTLLEPGSKILPETLATLATASDQGVLIFIATGRPLGDIIEILRGNGVLEARYPHALIAEERDIHDRNGSLFQGRQPRNGEHLALELAMSATIGRALEGCFPALAEIDPAFRAVDADRVQTRGYHELWFSSEEQSSAAATLLHARLPRPPHIIRNRRGVALRHPYASKGAALADLAAGLGLNPARVLAVGDAENDRSMLDGDHGFRCATPANAEPAIAELVRSCGGFVASKPRGLGVAEALRAMLE